MSAPEKILIDGPAGTLELSVTAPQEDATPPGVGIICHPHPLDGGTMDNKVAYMLGRSCNQAGLTAVRFNFRGVGRSEGEFDEGRGEVDDLMAVSAWARERWPDAHRVLLGFSFGAYVALQGATREAPAQLVTIAPPVFYFGDADIPRPDCPWLAVQGDADDVVDPTQVRSRLNALDPAPELVEMPGVGHFFHGRLSQLRDAVVPVLERRWTRL